MKVFLGGTANSTWRKELIPLLDAANIRYFNPIDDESQRNEIQQGTLNSTNDTPASQIPHHLNEELCNTNDTFASQVPYNLRTGKELCNPHEYRALQLKLIAQEHNLCDFVLYVLTPKMIGCHSIAEVVDDSSKRPERTILCILDRDGGEVFTPHQEKSMYQLVKMVEDNGAYCVITLKAVINTLMLKHPMGALYALK